MTLEGIKKKIIATAEEIDVLDLRLKIKGLEKEVAEVLAQFDKKDLENQDFVKKHISKESLSLIQTLLLLIN
ncbi:hypothetical protein [Metabacillus schmidteae]|uniref:hypothetical protein n=1 Tax=Metabacillus schmidteae TaxID=2730405 RepID=UPI001F1F537A|nr:hypothetical protein [Metabacillus schmidteae]